MIRAATEADCETISALGSEFFLEAGWADVADYLKADCAASLKFLASSEIGILLVSETDEVIDGMIGGMISPLYFNHAHKTGQEFFWWVRPEARRGVGLRLLDALEAEAVARGCTSWVMGVVAKVNAERTGKLLERRGYRAAENTYIKRLQA